VSSFIFDIKGNIREFSKRVKDHGNYHLFFVLRDHHLKLIKIAKKIYLNTPFFISNCMQSRVT